MLTYISKNGSLETINRFLVCLNYLVPFCVVLSDPGLESFLNESNEVGLFWGSVSIKLDKYGLERR